MTESGNILDAIRNAETCRAVKQIETEQAVAHRDSLIWAAVRDEGYGLTEVANAANLSVQQVEAIFNLR